MMHCKTIFYCVQAVLEQPQFTKPAFGDCDMEMEEGIPADVRAASPRVHKIKSHFVYGGRGNSPGTAAPITQPSGSCSAHPVAQ
jgi:hypothetical protein